MAEAALGIVGLGVLGASLGLRYRHEHPDLVVFGVEPDPEHRRIALERGAVTALCADVCELAEKVDILVLAMPVAAVLAALARLNALPRAGAWPRLIIDVASVKRVVAELGQTVPMFVPTHPMAGSEASGPQAARADLFQGRPWAYVPVAGPEQLALLHELVAAMGAHPLALEAVAHDELVARTSHLPQSLATVLALQALREPTAGLFGQGLLDMLRLARSSDHVWNAIYQYNAQPIATELEAYAQRLLGFAQDVRAGRLSAVSAAFAQANSLAAGLPEPDALDT